MTRIHFGSNNFDWCGQWRRIECTQDLLIGSKHMADLCLLCATRPRHVRLQCGHLFACAECVQKIRQCAMCRNPITAVYDINNAASQSESSEGGYVSSGSGTYRSKETCINQDCWSEASKWFACLDCARQSRPVRLALCAECGVRPPTCPHCRQACADDRDRMRDSESSGDSPRWVAEAVVAQHLDRQAEDGIAGFTTPRRNVDSDAVYPSEANPGPLQCLDRLAMKAVVDMCVHHNCIVEIADNNSQLVDRPKLALEVGRRCIMALHAHDCRKCNCVILAPTVPMVKQRSKVAQEFESLGVKTKFVIAGDSVDAWTASSWTNVLEQNDVLITTPQLFRECLNLGHMVLSRFCALIVEDCQLCHGGHAYARIFSEHYASRTTGIRVLGLTHDLVNRKITEVDQKLRADDMASLMQCQVLDLSQILSDVLLDVQCAREVLLTIYRRIESQA